MSSTIPKAALEKYLSKMAQINDKAAALVKEYLDKNGLKDPDGLVRYTHAVVAKYGEASSALACQMYDLTAEFAMVNVPPAEPAPTATYQETAKAVMGSLKQSPMGLKVPGVASRLTKQAGADTSMQNAIRDHAYWSWVPYGAETCPFCITLASQGYVPASKNVLMGNHAQHIHENCKCEFIVTFGKELISGYNPNMYRRIYENADDSSAGTHIQGNKVHWQNESTAKINGMRRVNYAENKDVINAQKRAAYALRKEEGHIPKISGKQFVQSNSKYAVKVGDMGFNNFDEVKSYIYEAKDIEDLQSRRSALERLYGTDSEQMNSLSLNNVFKTAEKNLTKD